jgi:hypothetical protein
LKSSRFGRIRQVETLISHEVRSTLPKELARHVPIHFKGSALSTQPALSTTWEDIQDFALVIQTFLRW